MKILAVAVALFAVLAFAVGWKAGDVTMELLGPFALIAAYCCWRSAPISRFLKIFIALFSVETIVFGLADFSARFGYWPKALEEAPIPTTLVLTVAIFAIIVFAVHHIPVVLAMTRIADRFFCASDITVADFGPLRLNMLKRVLATGMVVFLVLINQAQVAISVRLSFFNRDFFNAIQEKNGPEFWRMLIWVFMPWAFIYVASAVIEYVISSYLVIRWRRWLTRFYINHWLEGHTHYRMSLIGGVADNPDQRISEDVARFIDGGGEGGAFGYGVYNYSIMLISTLSSLVSFAILLWSLSANFTFPGTNFALPGLLFWVALLYAATGTGITHLIGRPLTKIMFARQKAEADFRFSLARLREYSEQVALLDGEEAEQVGLRERFGALIANYLEMIDRRKKLVAFTGFYGQVSPLIPYVFAAPFYFAGKIALGVMTQTAQAFGHVEGALTFFITNYTSLAGFRAVLDRLTVLRRGHRGGAGGRRVQTRPQRPGPCPASRQHRLAERIDFAALGRSDPDGRPQSAGHRTVRSRKIDPFPRAGRCLAVRLRRSRSACRGLRHAVAAKTLCADRHAAGGGRLSGRRRYFFR